VRNILRGFRESSGSTDRAAVGDLAGSVARLLDGLNQEVVGEDGEVQLEELKAQMRMIESGVRTFRSLGVFAGGPDGTPPLPRAHAFEVVTGMNTEIRTELLGAGGDA
jgi:hypothetical protein